MTVFSADYLLHVFDVPRFEAQNYRCITGPTLGRVGPGRAMHITSAYSHSIDEPIECTATVSIVGR